MRLVSESKVRKVFLSKGINFDQAHLLSMEAVILLLENEELEIEQVVSQLIERGLAKG